MRRNVWENEGREVYGDHDYPGFEGLERIRRSAELEDAYGDESEHYRVLP